MKTVVIYRSKTGFAQKYAEWLSKELSADRFDVSSVTVNMLEAYDTIIYGGGLYAVGINGLKFITNNLDKLKDKKIVVFATGLSLSKDEVINDVFKKNFTPEQQKLIKFFYLRGGFDYKKLNVVDKVLMNLLKISIKWKEKRNKPLTSDEKGMLSIYDKSTDFTCKTKIDEIVAYVHGTK
ncbi:flavodoxin domain-containing protein [Desulfosporosinus sp. FKB]|uniref:flavodoxin domain-containing protein n=1 Tax=Desulfosporosinus sp. FKB TaxID=1969835 RepID=UPI000B499DDF|nr:flavodoxin domain-containing protein [Desulfosporosinus sp. FKB]